MIKCHECFYGAKMQVSGSLWIFKKVIKKIREINYDNDEPGCRLDRWNEQEERCLNNNFSEFEEFKENNNWKIIQKI